MEFYGTIGPACAQPETLRQMVEAGMTGIRMNLSHGSLAEHADWLSLIRAAGIRELLIDLQGPELRIGTLPQPLVLEPGQSLRLGQGGVPCPTALVHAARPGQNLLLDDGRLLVQVAEADGAALQCTVVRGGTLQSRKSLAAPGLTVASPTLTEEDLQNLQLAGACGVTGVMLPFVRGAEDIRTLRRALQDAGADGIRNIIDQMGTDVFNRIKVGIGEKPKGWDLADYVLAKFSPDDLPAMEEGMEKAVKGVELILSRGVAEAANRVNQKPKSMKKQKALQEQAEKAEKETEKTTDGVNKE